jgi:glycosyltransferase involved in cell wall biosynthesis
VSYKKVSLIVNAFNRLGKPLVVIGTGPDLPRLQALAGKNVQILGKQPDAVVQEYMGKAKAFVYAACEDFGMALVEAQACGTPVIAYGFGGALETVRDIREHATSGTGLFFHQQSEEAIIEAVEAFEWYKSRLSPEMARSQAERFTPTIFQEKYVAFVRRCLEDSAPSAALGTSASTSSESGLPSSKR